MEKPLCIPTFDSVWQLFFTFQNHISQRASRKKALNAKPISWSPAPPTRFIQMVGAQNTGRNTYMPKTKLKWKINEFSSFPCALRHHAEGISLSTETWFSLRVPAPLHTLKEGRLILKKRRKIFFLFKGFFGCCRLSAKPRVTFCLDVLQVDGAKEKHKNRNGSSACGGEIPISIGQVVFQGIYLTCNT